MNKKPPSRSGYAWAAILIALVLFPSAGAATADDHMIFVEGGTFSMGDTFGDAPPLSQEVPLHEVTVSGFYIGRYEVTVGEFREFAKATKYVTETEKAGGGYLLHIEGGPPANFREDAFWDKPYFEQAENSPVVLMTLIDAARYCNWRSEKEGLKPCFAISGKTISCDFKASGYRLPTEAEWEYAARERGHSVRFGNGLDIADPSQINFRALEKYSQPYSVVGLYRAQTMPVGSFAPNALGIYDMAGNAIELCWDEFGLYSSSTQKDPTGPERPQDRFYGRVVKGGSWAMGPNQIRVASRYGVAAGGVSGNGVGFRIARGKK